MTPFQDAPGCRVYQPLHPDGTVLLHGDCAIVRRPDGGAALGDHATLEHRQSMSSFDREISLPSVHYCIDCTATVAFLPASRVASCCPSWGHLFPQSAAESTISLLAHNPAKHVHPLLEVPAWISQQPCRHHPISGLVSLPAGVFW